MYLTHSARHSTAQHLTHHIATIATTALLHNHPPQAPVIVPMPTLSARPDSCHPAPYYRCYTFSLTSSLPQSSSLTLYVLCMHILTSTSVCTLQSPALRLTRPLAILLILIIIASFLASSCLFPSLSTSLPPLTTSPYSNSFVFSNSHSKSPTSTHRNLVRDNSSLVIQASPTNVRTLY